MGLTIDERIKRSEIEQAERWGDFQEHKPFIELKPGWKIRVTPAFGGAIFRFRLESPAGNEYSVYFDAFDRLGIYGAPYYELFPHENDVFRSDSIKAILDAVYAGEG